MKFGETFKEYLHGEQEWFLHNCSHVEYKHLKKVLKNCRACRAVEDSDGGGSRHEEHDELSDVCHCISCPACDQKFFSELTREASEIAGCFSSRVQRLLHLHASSPLQRCMWRVHGSVNGRNFKTKMRAEKIELLQSPWLIELGAFYLNFRGSEIGEPGEFFREFTCDLSGTQPVMTMTLSNSVKYEYSLTCAVCLDTVFNPYALSCGHLFCKSCACSSASVLIFQGLKTVPHGAKCPVCRNVDVYRDSVHMTELDLLLKNRCKEYWKERLRGERAQMVKESKTYWESQRISAMSY